MQSTGKIILWVVVAIIVLGGLYYWYMQSHQTAMPASDSVSAASSDTSAENGPALASGSDTSDVALQSDLSGMDGQMSAMDSDTASIDQGLNDKPVSQDY